MAIKAIITPTVKGYHHSSTWSRYPDTVLFTASDLHEARTKLVEHYGKAWKGKRPTYIDTKQGTKRSGWVVGFRVDNGPGERYLQQDWVSLVDEHIITWGNK